VLSRSELSFGFRVPRFALRDGLPTSPQRWNKCLHCRSLRLATFVFSLLLTAVTPPLIADDKATPERTLDEELLDGLNNDLLDGLDNLPSLPTVKEKEETSDAPLPDQVGEGEDIEVGQASDPLTRIGEKMRTVEQLISKQKTSDKTQRLQTEILQDIVILIESQKKKHAASSAASKSNQPKNGKQGNQSNPMNGTDGTEDSTSRVGKAEVEIDEMQSRQQFLEELWGNLPERFLQQIRSAGDERFLPKYEKLIEDYYRRLAEDRRDYP